MAEPFLSEIRIMSFGFAPKGGPFATASSCLSTRTRRHAHGLRDRKLTPGGGFLDSAYPF
jgi:hypothetical protein